MKKFFSFVIMFAVITCNFTFAQPNKTNCCLSCNTRYYCDTYYETGSGSTTITKSLEFDHYEMDDVHLDRFCPTYTAINYVNNCAPAAGTIVVGYHDYVCTNLIPDFTPGFYIGNIFINNFQNSKVDAVQDTLYALMGTNTIEPGTSISQFQTGLTSYVNGQSYSISYSSCGTTFNLSTALSYLNNQVPIVLFMYGFDYYPEVGLYLQDGCFNFVGRRNPNGHVAVVFGYRQYRFYDSDDELIETDNYLVVSYGDATQGLIDMGQTTIDASYAIDIY